MHSQPPVHHVFDFSPVFSQPPKPFSACKSLGMFFALIGAASWTSAAVYTIADGDVRALNAALAAANRSASNDTINLAYKGKYALMGPLVAITGGGTLTIVGNRATIAPSSATRPFSPMLQVIKRGVLVMHDVKFTGCRPGIDASAVRCAIFNDNRCELQNVAVVDNATRGIFNWGDWMRLSNCRIAGNNGGIVNSGGGELDVARTVVANNSGLGEGGGILNIYSFARISDSLLVGNRAVWGGGLAAYPADQRLVVLNSLIADNTAQGSGGGIALRGGQFVMRNSEVLNNRAMGTTRMSSTGEPDFPSGGGGIHATFGDMDISDSTISSNRCIMAGAGIRYKGWPGRVVLTNSTISDNVLEYSPEVAEPVVEGIGLRIESFDGTVCVTHCTNTANRNETLIPMAAGGVYCDAVEAYVSNTIMAGNDGTDWSGPAFALVGGNFIGGDPRLLPLADNGGPTLTHAPMPDSPVINAGLSGLARDPGPDGVPFTADDSTLKYDQRGLGFNRVVGSAVDIGAFEVGTTP